MNQLVLPLRLDDHAVFSSFLADGNESLVATLAALADGESEHGCWIWGAPSTGKTHLLQAVCDRAGDQSVYLPLRVIADAGPQLLDGLESRALVCIDDLDCIAGEAIWEEGLFHLINQLVDGGGQLLVAANSAPRECPIALPDLASRLSRLPVFHLHSLNDAQRVAALQLRASQRGLELPDDAARYLIRRSRRDMTSLYALLDKLDLEALRAQRRLTVPFVRDVLQM
jgi:DnaA family protein